MLQELMDLQAQVLLLILYLPLAAVVVVEQRTSPIMILVRVYLEDLLVVPAVDLDLLDQQQEHLVTQVELI